MALTILITSGPTREYIDPVRFISNASSGKMGKAIAEYALEKDCNVIVIKGPSVPIETSDKCKVIDVISTEEMLAAVKRNLKYADVFIGAAAVSDYRPVKVSKIKIKKDSDILNLQLIKNPDIIKYVAEHKKNQIVIGFALESNNLLSYAKKKLKEKNLDMIVANDVSTIGSNKSMPCLLFKCGKTKKIKLSSKENIAKEIINEAIRIFKNNNTCKKNN
ncbi:MAG: phosphopantothenoylcysteine decarboxylase [Endomicrobiaceae bacterium]|nr:phosphopantothenoylcysteine decarboxylase [Endomicrobiaceae bacterium]